jgi:hypothetical protein
MGKREDVDAGRHEPDHFRTALVWLHVRSAHSNDENTKKLADVQQNTLQAALVLKMRGNSGTAHLTWKGVYTVQQLPITGQASSWS